MWELGFHIINWVFLEGSEGTQCSGGQAWSWECFLQPVQTVAVPPSLPLAGEWVCLEGRRAPDSLRTPGTPRSSDGSYEARPETFITTATGERLSFGCAGPTKTILFMCFQALKNSFRAHQWGVNRNFEIRKMPAG